MTDGAVVAGLAGTAVVAIAALAGTAVVLALRLARARERLSEEAASRQGVEVQLQSMAREYSQHRARAAQQLEALRDDIAELEVDLEGCATPGAVRARLDRLLSKAGPRQNSGDAPRLSGSPARGTDTG